MVGVPEAALLAGAVAAGAVAEGFAVVPAAPASRRLMEREMSSWTAAWLCLNLLGSRFCAINGSKLCQV